MKCLIDLDGVLCDLHNPWIALNGSKWPEHWPPGEYNMEKVFGWTNMWKKVDEKFWAELPLTPWAHELMDIVESNFRQKDICLVTVGPIHEDYSHIGASGKIQWIKKHFPQYFNQFLIGPARQFCADSTTILIDDYDGNIDKFRANGGVGILFPRIWNSNYQYENRRIEYTIGQLYENC